jgi:glycosyltransferase involved in cell wall biosynthesis
MKLLWVKTDFLHPTRRGGQIRTLEMLKRLHTRHEIHYVAFRQGDSEEVERSREYCSRAYPIDHRLPDKNSLAFAPQLLKGVFSPLPVAVGRYRSSRMRREIEKLVRQHGFDHVVCDFLAASPNIADLKSSVLFQHNVEAEIWKQYAQAAPTLSRQLYFRLQASRMRAYESYACRSAKSVIAVSDVDAHLMRDNYKLERVSAVPTGVDVGYFSPQNAIRHIADVVFVGAMDWMPNIDGARWFVREVLPHIRRHKPDCSVAFVGRNPAPELLEFAKFDRLIQVTGSTPDIRPYLWAAKVSIVPLRIGSGTRLKIFESMAARVPVVSTTIGAQGLPVENSRHLHMADDPREFAECCRDLLDNQDLRAQMSHVAWDMVSSNFSWERVSKEFERLLPN